MAAKFAYFSIFIPNSLNANSRISIGPYSETSKITTVKKSPGGEGGIRVAHGLLRGGGGITLQRMRGTHELSCAQKTLKIQWSQASDRKTT